MFMMRIQFHDINFLLIVCHMISIHYIAYFYYYSFFINVVSYIGHIYLTEYDDVPNSKSRPRGLVNVTICWLSSNAPLSLCNIFVGPGFLVAFHYLFFVFIMI